MIQERRENDGTPAEHVEEDALLTMALHAGCTARPVR